MNGFGESTNWALANGEPVAQIPTKDGKKLKKPNIKDARERGFFPRVTSVIKMIASPTLNEWRVKNAIEKCWLNEPYEESFGINREGIEPYKERILGIIQDELEESSERGKTIHGDLSRWIASQKLPEDEVSRHLCEEIEKWCSRNGVVAITSENNFCNREIGFAGTDDMEAILEDGSTIILDLKTRKNIAKNNKPYEKDLWQMAGYSIGRNIDDPKRLVLVICDQFDKNADVVFHNFEKEEIRIGREQFNLILSLWKSVNEYYPERFGK